MGPGPPLRALPARGYYASAARGKRRRLAAAANGECAPRSLGASELPTPGLLSWAKLIHRVYEVDPLLCPFCGAEMKILAFLLDCATVRAIRKSLNLLAQEPEPPAHGLPRELELLDQTA